MVKKKKSFLITALLALVLCMCLVVPAAKTEKVQAAQEGRAFGIDVSSYNGTINWQTAKANGVQFAIIRIGYGDDLTKQDDKRAQYNMEQCELNEIPYGVYIYSYALTEKEVDSEIAHTARMIKGFTPTLGIWFDMEDADAYKERNSYSAYKYGKMYTNFCLRFMRGMKALGYEDVGVYANTDYFNNVLNYKAIRAEGMIWLAHWGVASPPYECDLWQYSAEGKVNGLNGKFDVNYLFSGSPLYRRVVKNAAEMETINREEAPFLAGDIDGDGMVTMSDLTQLRMHINGAVTLEGDAFACADMNGDGRLSSADLTLLKNNLIAIDLEN